MVTMEEINRERIEISNLIRETPRADQSEVMTYHASIIPRLDSGIVITVPSIEHRQLHQDIWFVAFMIYNKYDDPQKAFIDFLYKPIHWSEGQVGPERLRFDVFYEKAYVEPFLNRVNSTVEWAKRTKGDAERDSLSTLYMPLEEIIVKV